MLNISENVNNSRSYLQSSFSIVRVMKMLFLILLPTGLIFYYLFIPHYTNFHFDTYMVKKIDNVRFLWQKDGVSIEKFKTAKKIVDEEGKSLLFATNGGIFDRNLSPLGLYVEGGNEWVGVNASSGTGNFFLKPNGVLYLEGDRATIIEADKYVNLSAQDRKKHLYAIQSGPMLVIDGHIHPAFNRLSDNLFTRSGVGINGAGKLIFVLSKEPLNLYTFADYFKDGLGCDNALYLDGAISSMYMPGSNPEFSEGSFATFILEVQ